MPNYKSHLAGGVIVYFIGLYCIIGLQAPTIAIGFEWLLFTLAGSLFPDIDIKSKGQKFFYWVMLLLAIMLLINERHKTLIVVALLSFVPLLVKHRGIFHRLWFVILVPVLVGLIICFYIPECKKTIMYDCLFFIIGAISHLWLDLGFFRMIRW